MIDIIIIKIICILMISIMFIYSGYDKIISFDKVATGLNTKMIFNSIPLIFSQLAIIICIILELVSPILILYGLIKKDKRFMIAGLAGLIIFTVLASVFYHKFSFEDNGMLKNVAIVGALLFIMLSSY